MDDAGRRENVRVKARLKVRFKDASSFISEYTHNISKGGLFVRTQKPCPIGSTVEVILVMPESEKEISSLGEVIHVVPAEKTSEAQPAGMGLQLRELAPADHDLIEAYIKSKLETGEVADVDRRQHKRFETRIRVRFGSVEALKDEYSHNISHGGIYIRTRRPKPLHEKLKIILAHPESGEEMILEGEVVRMVGEAEAERTKQPPGMGIRFLAMDRYTTDQIAAFINSEYVQNARQVEIEET